MRRSLVSCPLVILLAALIHADYHVARPHHMRLSLEWELHWLLALPVFALAAAYVRRRSPGRVWQAGALTLLLAAVGAQVVEPLAEELFYDGRFGMEVTGLRWMLFAEFMAAGVVAFAATVVALDVWARRREPAIHASGPAA